VKMKLQEENLIAFYTNYFPYDSMFKWLTNGDESCFKKREFSFTTEDDIYMRYKSFDNAEQFKKDMLTIKPRKIDIGSIFSVPPPQHKQVQPGVFVPVSKEYVIDIDISDYDNVRFCGCKDAKYCEKCWPLMLCGMKALDHLLGQCFGFDHRLWIYSGRRGVHCWVSDDEARNLDNESRSAVTDFLHIYIGNDKSGKKLTLNTRFTHPTFAVDSELFSICEQYFIDIYCDRDADRSMNIFENKDTWIQLVNLLDGNDSKLKTDISNCIEDANENYLNGEETWEAIKQVLTKMSRVGYIPYIVYSFVYPRLDANVSKQLNHLLKSPFCVHPSTEYICVPVSGYEFYPETDCPSVRELTEGSDTAAEQWQKSVKIFESHLKKLAKPKVKKQERDDMDIDF